MKDPETAGWDLANILKIFGLENRWKSRQIIYDYIYLPFYLLFISGAIIKRGDISKDDRLLFIFFPTVRRSPSLLPQFPPSRSASSTAGAAWPRAGSSP
jgi:hypothetical protein